MTLVLGAIADDFTGATDLANTLVTEGMRTVQVIEVPDPDTDIGDAEAVVVALKSRTSAPDNAVRKSLAVLDWLRDRGARQILFKYCSTFDSTAHGNIGPVADALMGRLGADFALVCPAFPGTGRTIYKGNLFVGDLPLHESSMKDHPLTPMRDSNLMRLMGAQSRHSAGLVSLQTVREGPEAIAKRIVALQAEGHRYGVADVVADDDLRILGRALKDVPLVTGGSGIALGLPANLRAAEDEGCSPSLPDAEGRTLFLAGSCSTATRRQINEASRDCPTRKFTVDDIFADPGIAEALADWAEAQDPDRPVLIYASADPAEIARMQEKHGRARAGAMVEDTMGALAVLLTERGFRRIAVAGGETSGAVVSALGITALTIGPQISPGVPWCAARGLALALKSGNFGEPDFFLRAARMLP